MKDSLEFDDEEKMDTESNWHMGLTSTPSFDTLGSKVVLQPHNLQILIKKETPSGRRIIPATLLEKLSYYRSFTSSPSKTQIVSMQQVFFNKYFWFYLFNVFFKSLPSTYVYIFLSSYAAEDHLFVAKMIPLCYGHIWFSIISGLFAVINCCGYVALLWDYVISGLLYKNPWNRCASFYNISTNPKCYEVKAFAKKIMNKTLKFQSYGYVIKSNGSTFEDEYLQIAPLLFLKSRLVKYSFKPSYFWLFEATVFVIACLFYKQLFQKYIWKILHYVQCALLLMYLTSFIHLVIFNFFNGFNKLPNPIDEIADELWVADVDMLAESMTSPPIVHILSARGNEKPKPSRDSTRIVVSNSVYYIFKALLAYLMKRYCEHLIGISLIFTDLNPCSSFFFWPIYLSYFYLGDYYTIMYFFFNAVEEFLVLAITLYCLIEVIACEWGWLKPWAVALFLSILTAVLTFATSVNYRSALYVYMTGLTTFSEIIVVFCLYPLGRLVDDITFHCGAPPTTIRLLNFRTVPVFYSIKIFTMFFYFYDILHALGVDEELTYFGFYAPFTLTFPFILGFFYAIYNIVYRKNKGWKQLFIPVPEWGPKDLTVRQLRNLYDSRQYIGSQAPRELSRYLMKKAEMTTCQVDIEYDSHNKQWDIQSVRYEEEKKSN